MTWAQNIASKLLYINVHDNILYTQQNSLLSNYEDFANKAVLLYYGTFVKSDIHPIQCFTNIVY